MTQIIKNMILIILTGLTMMSCQDDINLNLSPNVIEGKPASVTLKVNVPEMTVKSRSMIDDDAASEVTSLWLGVYTADGTRLFSKIYDFSSTGHHTWKDEITLNKEDGITSGRRRIVAVANVTNNFGITDNKDMIEKLGLTQRVYLSDLLEAADTWDKYKSISATVTDLSAESQEPALAGNLVMSGLYHNSQVDPESWVDHDGFVDIQPGDNGKLSGGIHLRRTISYVRFNLRSEAPDGYENFVVTPTSWSVKNVPVITYLYETERNAADESEFLSGNLTRNYKNYETSYVFEREDDENQNTTYYFDFYQLDNKHTGTANNYNEREQELKDGELNTGWYTALDAKGQNATYVEFTADISYYCCPIKLLAR